MTRRNLKVQQFTITDFQQARRRCLDSLEDNDTMGAITSGRVNIVEEAYVIPRSWIKPLLEEFPNLQQFKNSGTEQVSASTREGFRSLPDNSITITTHTSRELGAILPVSMGKTLKDFARRHINKDRQVTAEEGNTRTIRELNNDQIAAFANAVYAILQLAQKGISVSSDIDAVTDSGLKVTNKPSDVKKNRRVVEMICEDESGLDFALSRAFERVKEGSVVELNVSNVDGTKNSKPVWLVGPRV